MAIVRLTTIFARCERRRCSRRAQQTRKNPVTPRAGHVARGRTPRSDVPGQREDHHWPRVGQRISHSSATVMPTPLATGATTSAADSAAGSARPTRQPEPRPSTRSRQRSRPARSTGYPGYSNTEITSQIGRLTPPPANGVHMRPFVLRFISSDTASTLELTVCLMLSAYCAAQVNGLLWRITRHTPATHQSNSTAAFR